ncbi:30S ribosomal protein S7 [Candidatus Vidania fulgoroideorum]
MSRKKNKYIKKIISIDNKYRNYFFSKFVNILMVAGKKSKSLNILYKTFAFIKNYFNVNPIYIFIESIKKIRPKIEIKNKKVGGTYYKVPIKINFNKGIFKAMKWIKINSINKNKPFYLSLAIEIVNGYFNTGNSIKNRDLLYKLAEANRAFSHFIF